jgi:hypothetical protein
MGVKEEQQKPLSAKSAPINQCRMMEDPTTMRFWSDVDHASPTRIVRVL